MLEYTYIYFMQCKHGKNSFAKKLETRYRSKNNLLLVHQNNYIGCPNWLLECQNFLQHRYA